MYVCANDPQIATSIDIGVTNKFSPAGEFASTEFVCKKNQLYLGVDGLGPPAIPREAFWRDGGLLSGAAAPLCSLLGKQANICRALGTVPGESCYLLLIKLM